MKISISSRARNAVLTIAALLIVALVAYFFRNQFVRNWDQLRESHFRLSFPFLALSLICIILSYLVATAMWRNGVNLFASGRKFSFLASVGMVNATQLTKYIPGKVWGYAMQMVLVDRSSLPASAVLYVNLQVVLSKLFISLLAGGLYFCFSSRIVPQIVSVLATASLLLVYVFFLLFNGRFFTLLIKVSGRILRRPVAPYELGLSDMMWMQILGLVSTVAFGLSAVFCIQGIGSGLTPGIAWSVLAGLIFSDTVGFLAFFVPGGLGVREGLYYLMLSEYGAGSLALILPIVMRVLSMIVDALLGLLGLIFLRKYIKDGVE